MADATTSNRNLTQPQVGGDSGTWGGVLNNGVMGQLDLVLGNTQAVTINSVDVTLSTTQWNNAAIQLTGTLTGNHNLLFPFNSNSATTAVGGYAIIKNDTQGAFNVTVKTAISTSTGVQVPQGLRTLVFSDGTNAWYADDAAAHITTTAGNPNTQLAGTAATVNSPPTPLAYDYNGGTGLWVPTTTGTATSTVWTQLASIGAALPVPEGYLTPVSNTPVITSDSIAATVIYYTPFTGTFALVHNGTQIIPYQMASQFSLTLTSSQAANGIYDIFLAYNGGVPVIGTGPSWSAGSGGSVTLGSCARGTGAGGTSLSRLQGVWTNTVSMSLIYNTGSGNNTITVPINQGIYLGSIFVDAAAGQVTCHRSYGQSRKFGLWNPYNRTPIILQAGDNTASWTYGTNTIRQSNAAAGNNFVVFTGLAEEPFDFSFVQRVGLISGAGTAQSLIGIGWNSTTAFSGKQGDISTANAGQAAPTNDLVAQFFQAPALGINQVNMLENTPVSSGGNTFYGTNGAMILSGRYRG